MTVKPIFIIQVVGRAHLSGKTILSGIISIVSDLRNVLLKYLVSLTTMKSW